MEFCPLCGQLYSGPVGIYIDEDLNDVIIDEEHIKMSHRLVQVFAGIVKSSPRAVTTDYLMDYVYGLENDNEPQDKVISIYIYKIREKIKNTRFEIQTVWGKGYRLKEKIDASKIHQKERSLQR